MGTVLINDVTKDDINAALIRIQKQIGGSGGGSGNAQGTSQTIQNIQIQNSGGSSSDLTPMVTQLRTTISEQNQRITTLENTNKELQRNLLDIQSVINNGVTGNITTVSFDDATRMLNFVTDASTGQVSIPDGAFATNISGPSAYLFSFSCREGEVARFSFCVGNAHKRDVSETDSLRVMSYSLINITVEKKEGGGARHIFTLNGFCTENPGTPLSSQFGMGDIVILTEFMDLYETIFKVYIVTDNTHNDFPVWWKVFINQTSAFSIGDYSTGPVDETSIFWNSRYGFNPMFSGNGYVDLTKSYSHFRNLAKVTETVNEVALNNMQSVSSNAVAQAIGNIGNFKIIESSAKSFTFTANLGTSVSMTFTVPSGYKSICMCGWDISGASGAINLYATTSQEFYNRSGTFTENVWFRNYTGSQYTVTIKVFLLCLKQA